MASSNGSDNHDLTPDSQTEDFEVISKPFDSQIPQPPPDIPQGWEGYQQEAHSLDTNGSLATDTNGSLATDTNGSLETDTNASLATENTSMQSLMSDIRSGAQLRRVQVQVRVVFLIIVSVPCERCEDMAPL